jgi:sulfite exporter TauE/SafE
MCGPLIAASANTNRAGGPDKPNQVQLLSIIQLQLGRVASYTLLGIAAGYFAAQFSQYMNPELAAKLRLVMLLLMVGLLALWWFGKPKHSGLCQRSQHSNRLIGAPFIRGTLLALIPCPLLFTVLIYCSLTLSPLIGGLCMLSFGLAAALLPSIAAAGLQHWQYKFMPHSKAIAACSLLVLGIGITFFMPTLAPSLYCL